MASDPIQPTQTPPKSKRDMMSERLRSKYPDREFADDEAMYSQIYDDYDSSEKELGGYKDREKKLTDLLVKDPHAAGYLTGLAEGKGPIRSLVESIGIENVKAMLDDPSLIDDYAADNQKYLERLAKSEQLQKEWEANMVSTLRMLEQKQREQGLSDEQIDAAADWIKGITADALTGVIRPETVDMALKAINHDSDVQTASQEGEVRGRNTKAEAALRKPSRSDGTPVLAGANNAPAPSASRSSIFDIASQA